MAKISVTSLSSFSECRRKWYWNQKYQTLVPSRHFWIGQVVHAGLEAYYKNNRNPSMGIEAAKAYANTEIDLFREKLPSIASVEGELQPSAEEALGFLWNYFLYDKENPLEGEVLQVELPFEIPIRNQSISGRIDLVLQSSSGRLWVVDHKTVNQKPNLKGLDVDEQMTAYAWAVWRLFGEIPEKIIYNVIIKSLPTPPSILKRGGLSKDKNQLTTPSLYRQTIDELGLNPEDYQDILEHLSMVGWSKFFVRVESFRSFEEVKAFERRALVKARDIQAILSDPETEAYPSPSTISCSYCDFLEACKAKDCGEDAESILSLRFIQRF